MANTYQIIETVNAQSFVLDVFKDSVRIANRMLFITKDGESQLQNMVDSLGADGDL
jgi:hypothetical protein